MHQIKASLAAVLLSTMTLVAAWAPAQAQQTAVKIGIVLATSGPGASVGVVQRNALTLWPSDFGGRKLNVIVQDDRSEPAAATAAARRLVSDDQVDILVGSSLVPDSFAVASVAAEAETVQLMIAPTPLANEKSRWSFQTVPLTGMVASAVFVRMKKSGVKTVGYIGFSDSWGDQWLGELKSFAEKNGMSVTAEERFGRGDTTVSGQCLKVIATKPDAILVGGSASGAALVQTTLVDQRYGGPIYHTHGAVSPDFVRLAGKKAEGAMAPSAPNIVSDELPESYPSRQAGIAFFKSYEEKFGPGRPNFAPLMNDVLVLLQKIVPVALAKAEPGTKAFRAALRDAMEAQTNVVVTQGVFNFSPTNHVGLDERGRVMVLVRDGRWHYSP